MVLRQIVIHEASELLVDHALLFEGHADTPDDSTHDLTSRRFRIQDAAAGNSGDDTRDLNYSQVLINFYLRKYGRMRVSDISRLPGLIRSCGHFLLDIAGFSLFHRSRDRNSSRRIRTPGNSAIGERHLVALGVDKRGVLYLARAVENLLSHLLAHCFDCRSD